jgi:hypothetical protein
MQAVVVVARVRLEQRLPRFWLEMVELELHQHY